jgi:hypothetical protein
VNKNVTTPEGAPAVDTHAECHTNQQSALAKAATQGLRHGDRCNATHGKRAVHLGFNNDPKHALGFILRQAERLHGILDGESVCDQSAAEFRTRRQ